MYITKQNDKQTESYERLTSHNTHFCDQYEIMQSARQQQKKHQQNKSGRFFNNFEIRVCFKVEKYLKVNFEIIIFIFAKYVQMANTKGNFN